MSKKVVLAGAVRTAIGKMGGALTGVPAEQLGTIVIKEALSLFSTSVDDESRTSEFLVDHVPRKKILSRKDEHD